MNIYQIAKQAGVSPATVSRVINGNEHVSEELRTKVKQVMEESGYIPNFFARGLNKMQTKTVGILCPVISDINHAKLVSTLEQYLRRLGFDIILCSQDNNYEKKEQYLELLLQKQVEAIFLIGLSPDDEEGISSLESIANNIPVIIVNGMLDSPNIYCVVCEEEQMSCNLVNKLCLSGYPRVMYIYDTNTYSGNQKKAGYERGMRNCGTYSEDLILKIPEQISMKDIVCSTEMIRDFISKMEDKPEAIITADDILAAPAQKAIQELDMQIPIIGWNNSMYSQIATPTITSVDINVEKLSEAAVTILMNLLNEKKSPKCIYVLAELIMRESYVTDHN